MQLWLPFSRVQRSSEADIALADVTSCIEWKRDGGADGTEVYSAPMSAIQTSEQFTS
jgi:hypothetical protein